MNYNRISAGRSTTYDLLWENPAYLNGLRENNFAGFRDYWVPSKKFRQSSGHSLLPAALQAVVADSALGRQVKSQGDTAPDLVKIPRHFITKPTALGQLSWNDLGVASDDVTPGVPDTAVQYSANSSLSDAFGGTAPAYASMKSLAESASFHFVSDFTPGDMHNVNMPSIKGAALRLVKIQLQFSKAHHNIDSVVLGMDGIGTHGGLHTAHATSVDQIPKEDIVVLCDPDKRVHEEFYNTVIGRAPGEKSTIQFGVKKFTCTPKHGMCHAGLSAGSQVAFSGTGIEAAVATWAGHDPSVVGHTQGHLIRAKVTLEVTP